jgi:hypothetical protein
LFNAGIREREEATFYRPTLKFKDFKKPTKLEMDPARKKIGVAVNTEVQENEEMEKKVYPQIRKMFEVERKGCYLTGRETRILAFKRDGSIHAISLATL